jgi:carbon-monoxide dehydrogenase large subunit
MVQNYIGAPILRKEDRRFLMGRARFTDDVKLPHMLHAAIIRSPHAHALIKSIDASEALEIPGVVAVYSAADVEAVLEPKRIPLRTSALEGLDRFLQYPFARGKVRYVGDPVAVVVAESRHLAEDAIDVVKVEYEPLPVVTDVIESYEGKVLLHEEHGTNVAADQTVSVGDVEEAFRNAEYTRQEEFHIPRYTANPLETRGLVASYDPGRHEMTCWGETKVPYFNRGVLSSMLDMPTHALHFFEPDVGGGFGARGEFYPEDFMIPFASKMLGRPVKWIEDRSEAFMTTIHGRDIIGYVDIAATSEGKVLGLKIRMIADIGAYEMVLTAAIPTLSAFMLSGVYEIGAVRCDLTEVFTNKMPTDAYRGAGRPEGIFFVERAMDLLARELDLDPAELRRRNFIQPEQFPYTTAGGMVYDSGEYERALDLALENAGWEQMKADRDAARAEGRVVGIGLSFYTEICGFGPSAAMPTVGLWEYGSVSVERDGKVRATTGASSHGQGHETTFSQLLADEFGVPIDDITIVHGDTGQVRAGTGTFGSRSMAVGGTAILHAAEKVKDKMRRFGAQMMELPPDDLEFRAGMIGPRGAEDTGVSFAEVAAFAYIPLPLPPDTEPGLSEEAFWEPEGFTWPFGCYISQVELDRDTGELELQRFIGVDDCGNIINPLIVTGQIHGGIAQGVGQALIEEAVYDTDGQLVTASFMDYAMPRARDFPRFELDHTITPSPLNPMGVKGVGEAGTIGSTPCIVNAVVDALGEFGVTHIDMMLRPEKLWRVINGGDA